MPRTKLQNRPQPHAKLGLLIGGTVRMQGLSNEKIGRMIGKSTETARLRMKDPGSLTVDELTRLGKKTGIPIDELRAAISYQ